MNPRTLGLLALAGLALVAPMEAGSIFGFSFGGPDPVDMPRDLDVLGFVDVEDLEFPAFQTFTVTDREQNVVHAAPGMVFRTHRHMLARRKMAAGLKEETGLRVSRPLGTYNDEGMQQGTLMKVIVDDARRELRSTRLYSDEQSEHGYADFLDVLRHRLEAAHAMESGQSQAKMNVRELGFALTSLEGSRLRHLLLYKARKTSVDGTGFWVCDFYDPHAAPGSKARRSQLRVAADFGLMVPPDVRGEWAREVNAEGPDGFTMRGDEHRDWVPLGEEQLRVVDHAGDEWGLTEYAELPDVESERQAAEDRMLGTAQPLGGTAMATLEDWVGGALDFGSHDGRQEVQ